MILIFGFVNSVSHGFLTILFLWSKPNGEAVSRGGEFTESFGEMTIKVQ